MTKFSKIAPISSRVYGIVKTDVESKGASWLLTLGAGDCNDYAETVRVRASLATNGIDHVRFETVARYIRQYKVKLAAQQPK